MSEAKTPETSEMPKHTNVEICVSLVGTQQLREVNVAKQRTSL